MTQCNNGFTVRPGSACNNKQPILKHTCCLQIQVMYAISGRHTYTSGLNMRGMTGWKPAGLSMIRRRTWCGRPSRTLQQQQQQQQQQQSSNSRSSTIFLNRVEARRGQHDQITDMVRPPLTHPAAAAAAAAAAHAYDFST
jgi:hypothetical protein